MNILFDTSVLVPALVDQLSNHPVCFSAFLTYTSENHTGCCSTHALAECYSVLTALPLRRRISPEEASRLVNESVVRHLSVIELDLEDYRNAVKAAADRGLASGIVYDALHLAAARKASCDRILTYNINHFAALGATDITVASP